MQPHERRSLRKIIASLIRTIFAQPDANAASTQLRSVVDHLDGIPQGSAERLEATKTNLLAYTAFPASHWSKIWPNNPIELLNRELERQTDVLQILSSTESVIRPIWSAPRRDE